MGEAFNKESWHLSKSVPLAFLLAILLQTGGIIWWGATIQAKALETERRVTATEAELAKRANLIIKVSERLASLEANTENILQLLNRIDRQTKR